MLRVLTFCLAATLASGAAALAAAPQLPPQPATLPAGIPKGSMLLSPCISGMGEHWGALKDLPVGPIYGVYRGKVVFSEVMLKQDDFAAGKSYTDVLHALPGHSIDHVDIEFEPKGHEGFPIPHYDIHAYYVPHADHVKFCPSSGMNM